MLTDEIKQKVEAATVKIIMEDDGFGSGVLIPGRMILTATHCVQHTADGGMAIGDYYIETLETSQGFLKAGPIMVECVSDLAVLGGLDGQEFWDELTAFDEFCETVEPVGIHLKEVHPCMPFPAHQKAPGDPGIYAWGGIGVGRAGLNAQASNNLPWRHPSPRWARGMRRWKPQHLCLGRTSTGDKDPLFFVCISKHLMV